MKVLRRSIIAICSILLIPFFIFAVSSFPSGKYFDEYLKSAVKSGKAKVIEVNKKIKVDRDTIYIERIIYTESETYLRYKIVEEPGWGFSSSAIRLYDDKGMKHQTSGSSSGKIWGVDAIIGYEGISKDTTKIIIRVEWFDRKGEVVIPFKKGGHDL